MFLIYGKDNCPYCVQAKALIEQNQWPYEYKDIMKDKAARAEFFQKMPTERYVPQVFWNGEHVGGFDKLQAAVREGKFPKIST